MKSPAETVITATDFQLRVNEYFTKILQGENIVIERYGKKFAVLTPYPLATSPVVDKEVVVEEKQVPATPAPEVAVAPTTAELETLSASELRKLLRVLLS